MTAHPSALPRTAYCPICRRVVPVRLSRHEGVIRLTRHDVVPDGPSCPGTGKAVAP